MSASSPPMLTFSPQPRARTSSLDAIGTQDAANLRVQLPIFSNSYPKSQQQSNLIT